MGGVEVTIPYEGKYPRVDIIFLKDKDYYVVEVKELDEAGAKEGALSYAEILRKHLEAYGIEYERIIPVAVVSSGQI